MTTINIVNVQEDTEPEEKWQLGHLSKVHGTHYVMLL